jgi:K(+)-stimulated pyrophosphate-energized sodium pump
MNPVIKFTTLFGLLAVELALSVYRSRGDHTLNYALAAVFFLVSAYFVYRSFYGMRIGSGSGVNTREMGTDAEGLGGRQLEGGTRGSNIGVESGAARRDTIR